MTIAKSTSSKMTETNVSSMSDGKVPKHCIETNTRKLLVTVHVAVKMTKVASKGCKVELTATKE